jgi:uncharacterized protein (TIGR02466 family)
MIETINLFPSQVLISKMTDYDYIDDCLKEIYKLDQNDNDLSVRGGWQSDKFLYKNPTFSKLCDFILLTIKSNLLSDKFNPYISSLWANVHKKGGFNHVHIHPGSCFSGTYYLKCSDLSGKLIFSDPRHGAEMSEYHNIIENTNYSFTPKVGSLFIFPSWLPHYVEQNLDFDDRISVSFNVGFVSV